MLLGTGLFPGEAFTGPYPNSANGFLKGFPSPQRAASHMNMMPPAQAPPLYDDKDTDSLEDKLGGLALNPKAKEFVPPKSEHADEVCSMTMKASVCMLIFLQDITCCAGSPAFWNWFWPPDLWALISWKSWSHGAAKDHHAEAAQPQSQTNCLYL